MHSDSEYNSMPFTKYLSAKPAFLGACMLLFLAVTSASQAGGDEPYPSFVASYDAKANGFTIGSVEVTLTHESSGQYLYRQKSVTRGLAALFGTDESDQSSRWRFQDSSIQVLEYRSLREGGDDDDNEHLVFDWEARRVRNIGAGEHWDIEVPVGTIDRLVMQLGMLFDLRDGQTNFEYHIARQGRVKTYRFGVVGEEDIKLDNGTYRAIKVMRKEEDDDKSLVWSAPDLDYFPIRFLKHKKSGLKTELVLRKLEFSNDTGILSVKPSP